MVEQNKGNGQAGAAILGGAAGAAAGYLLGARQRTPAQGVPGAGVVTLDDASLQALLAVSDSMAQATALLQQLLSSGSYSGQKQPAPSPRMFTLLCPIAGQGEQLPDIPMTEDFFIVIKALSTNTGAAYVTMGSQAQNQPSSSYPLLANESIGFGGIANANEVYVASAVSGEGVAVTIGHMANGPGAPPMARLYAQLDARLVQLDASLSPLGLVRWGITREPVWTVGAENTAPGALTALVTKVIAAGKTGRLYGFHVSAGEANTFRVSDGTTTWTYHTAGAAPIDIVLPAPLIKDIAAGASITVKNVNAAAAGIVYQASVLTDEA